jgi:hypothetical protein
MVSKRQQGCPAPYAAAWLQRRIALKTARRDTAPTVATPLSVI